MDNKIKNWHGIWFLIMIALFFLSFWLSLGNLYIFLTAILFSFVLGYIGTRKEKESNWYPAWSLISILLSVFVFIYAFVESLGDLAYRPKVQNYSLKFSFNLFFWFFIILSIYLSIKGIRKAKELNGQGRKLSIVLLILVFSFFLFILRNILVTFVF